MSTLTRIIRSLDVALSLPVARPSDTGKVPAKALVKLRSKMYYRCHGSEILEILRPNLRWRSGALAITRCGKSAFRAFMGVLVAIWDNYRVIFEFDNPDWFETLRIFSRWAAEPIGFTTRMKLFSTYGQWRLSQTHRTDGDPLLDPPTPPPSMTHEDFMEACNPFGPRTGRYIKRLYLSSSPLRRTLPFFTALSHVKRCCEPISDDEVLQSVWKLQEQLTRPSTPSPTWLKGKIHAILLACGFANQRTPTASEGPNTKSCLDFSTKAGGHRTCIREALLAHPPDGIIRHGTLRGLKRGWFATASDPPEESERPKKISKATFLPRLNGPSLDEPLFSAPTCRPPDWRRDVDPKSFLAQAKLGNLDQFASLDMRRRTWDTFEGHDGYGLGYEPPDVTQGRKEYLLSEVHESVGRALEEYELSSLEALTHEYCQKLEIPHFKPEREFYGIPVKVHNVLEPLKVRTITITEGLYTVRLKPLQKKLHRALRSHRVFAALDHEFTDSDLNFRHFGVLNTMLSGDYEGSTNGLSLNVTLDALDCVLAWCPWLSPLDVEAARSSFRDVILTFPRVGKGKSTLRNHPFPVRLTCGQLMGNVLSFNLLCLINAAVYWQSMEERLGRAIPFDDLPVVINGDDTLGASDEEHLRLWTARGKEVGFVRGKWKNLVSACMGTFNSQPIVFTRNHDRFEGQRLRFTAVGLLAGCRKVQRQKQVEMPSWQRLASAHNKAIESLNRADTIEAFYVCHRDAINKLRRPHVNVFASPYLCGWGFVETVWAPRELGASDEWRCAAAATLNKLRQGVIPRLNDEVRYLPRRSGRVPKFVQEPVHSDECERVVLIGGKQVYPEYDMEIDETYEATRTQDYRPFCAGELLREPEAPRPLRAWVEPTGELLDVEVKWGRPYQGCALPELAG